MRLNDWTPRFTLPLQVDNAIHRLLVLQTEFIPSSSFDMNFSLFYYVNDFNTLLMMDSRAKNMMLASWDQTIWYPIFSMIGHYAWC